MSAPIDSHIVSISVRWVTHAWLRSVARKPRGDRTNCSRAVRERTSEDRQSRSGSGTTGTQAVEALAVDELTSGVGASLLGCGSSCGGASVLDCGSSGRDAARYESRTGGLLGRCARAHAPDDEARGRRDDARAARDVRSAEDAGGRHGLLALGHQTHVEWDRWTCSCTCSCSAVASVRPTLVIRSAPRCARDPCDGLRASGAARRDLRR